LLPSTNFTLTVNERLAVYLIFFYWTLYENIIFFNAADLDPSFLFATNFFKIITPFVLFLLTGVNAKPFRSGFSSAYFLFFFFFIAWIGFVTALNSDIIEWIKLLPRVVYFIAVVSLFIKSPSSFLLYAKLIISYVLVSLVQYIATSITGSWSSPVTFFGYESSGLYGLFSNITSRMYLPGFDVPILRLSGFWNEPSNAAGTAFSSFYLAQYLCHSCSDRKWYYVSLLCLLSGFLCFSNAGYFALGLSSLLGFVLSPKSRLTLWNLGRSLLLVIASILFLLLTFFGRSIVYSSFSDNSFLRAIVGLRETGDSIDVYGGRFHLLSSNLSYVSDNVLGAGLTVFNDSSAPISASALVYWTFVGGILSATLLLFRELVLFCASYKLVSSSTGSLYLFQALVAVIAQQLSYGSLMNPNYFVLAAAVLAFSFSSKRLPGVSPRRRL